jgi:hypothetical protein
MRLSRRVLTALVVGVFGIAMAVPASAQDPKPGQSFTDKGFTSRMPEPGYRHPPASYYKGQAFSVTFTLHNDSGPNNNNNNNGNNNNNRSGSNNNNNNNNNNGNNNNNNNGNNNNNNGPKTACFTLQVFRLPEFDAATARTETWLEDNLTENQVLVFDGARENLAFAAGETKTLTRGATLAEEGYYQFDYGFCSDVPLVPKAGYEGPMISGFVRVLGTAPTPPAPPSTPPPAATPAPSGSGVLGAGGAATARASALTLAATGSGAQQQGGVSWLGLLLWMGLLGAAGLGLALRRVR